MPRENEDKFLITQDCGRLARWLRLLGYDAALCDSKNPEIIYQRAYNEKRTVLTRNSRIRPSSLFKVVHISSQAIEEQLRQLIQELAITIDEKNAFTRCNICNVEVEPVDKNTVKDEVPPFVYRIRNEFHICPSCKRIYWEATHWDRAKNMIGKLKKNA